MSLKAVRLGTRLSLVDGETVTNGRISMAKITISLKPITRQISLAQKRLRAVLPKVGAGDRRKINLDVKGLNEATTKVMKVCRPAHGLVFTPSKKK